MKKEISVIIPAYNERERIGDTIKAARSIPGVVQIIVVDDGSSDETGTVARIAGGEVLTLRQNQGKGKALTQGIAHARSNIILLLDADLGRTATQGHLLAVPLLAGEVDMTVACFPPAQGRTGLGLALGLARYGTWLLTGLLFKAPLSGQRGFTKKALESLYPLFPGFGVEVGFNVRAVRQGLRIREIPVAMDHRVTGRDWQGFRHRARQFWHILLTLLRLLWEGRKEAF